MASKTLTATRLAYGQLTGSATPVVLYTAPASTTVMVTEMWLANTDSSARTITLYAVESGGTAAANRMILPTVSIAANTTYLIPCSLTLLTGETIQGYADTTLKVSYRFSGVTIA